jgi:hypothetical protein
MSIAETTSIIRREIIQPYVHYRPPIVFPVEERISDQKKTFSEYARSPSFGMCGPFAYFLPRRSV